MKIKEDVLKAILEEMPVAPPEAGGILGGREDIISICFADNGGNTLGCSYIPDVKKLNIIIKQWEKNKYYFMGIFHVHFFCVDTLSEGDIKYMERIMHAMPETIRKLYFPLVVQPHTKCVPYVAYKEKEGKILIRQDELEIL